MPNTGHGLTPTECGQRFHPPLHTSCTAGCLSAPSSGGAYTGDCPVRSPVTTLDCFLLRDENLSLVPRLGPKINSRACRWEKPRPCHRLWCWFASQQPILLLRSRFETPRTGSGPTNLLAEPFLASLSAVSLTLTPACPGTQQSHSMPPQGHSAAGRFMFLYLIKLFSYDHL
jgi:hypothetical protein